MSPATYDNTTQKVTKTLTITYSEGGKTETASYPITIVNDVQSIVVHDPLKTPYNVNGAFDNTVGSIRVTRAIGTPEIVKLNDSRIYVDGFSSAAENPSLPLTIKFTENTFDKTVTTNVEIKDSVISIRIKTPPKTAYKYNEELDVTGGKLEVTKGSGVTDIPMTVAMLLGYDKETLGNQDLTVSYGGKTATDPIVVNVKDYVTGIKVAPSTIERVVGEELSSLITSNNIKYIVTYAKAGDKSPVDLQVTMVTTTYDKTSKADQPLTITYTDNDNDSFTKGQPFTCTLNANFKNTAKEINITPPTKTVYKHAEALSLDGGEIKITNQDGTTSYVTMEPGMIKENGGAVNMSPSSYDSTNKVTKTLTIEYTKDGVPGTVDYPITIVNYVTKIKMQDNPKQSYNVNEAEDLSGGTILVTRKVGTPEVIDLTDTRVSVTGFNSSVETTSPLPITVTFTENGFSCDPTGYDITVTDSVTGIAIKTPPRRDQKYNEEIDLTGAMLTVTSGSGPRDIPITKDMLSAYDKETLGDQTLTVTYSGKTAPTGITVTVKDYVTGIKVNPDTVTGEYNKELADLITDNSITYTVTYAKAGDITPGSPLTESMVSGYSKTSKQTQNLTVTYEDNDNDSFTKGTNFPATLTVEANNPVTGITIKAPSKTTYKHGESLDLTGGTITLTHIDGTTSNVTMTDSMIKENGGTVNMSPSSYDNTNKVQKTLTIEYTKDGVPGTVNYPIEIVNYVTKIEMQDNPKQSYNVNDTEDLTGGSILVTRAVGLPEPIDLTDTRVSVIGFDSSSENTALPITVTFTENGFSCDPTGYNISIQDSVTDMVIKTEPKKDYKYNEELDVTGGWITVTKGSGPEDIQMTPSMVTGYNKTNLGEQTLTVTYGGITKTYKVTVKDYVTGIKVNPDTVTGKYNTELSKIITDNSITYTVTYAKAGDITPSSPLTESMVQGYSKTSKQTQNLKVQYTDNDTASASKGEKFEANLSITLENTVTAVTVTKPTKDKYNHGENLDLSTGKIVLTYEDGTTGEISITPAMVTEGGNAVNMSPTSYDNTNKVQKTLTITYTKDRKNRYNTISNYNHK